MVDEEELRRMSPQERLELRQALAALDDQDARASKAVDRRRKIIVAAIVICSLALAAWIGVLASTLPRYYRAGDWRGAWVGFDLAELAAFAVTGWAAWRRRQILIICLVVLATLLCCDAWFDVVLDARTKGFELSLLSALVIELPLALLAILGARRLLRMTNAVMLQVPRGVRPAAQAQANPPGRPRTRPAAHRPAVRAGGTARGQHRHAADRRRRFRPPLTSGQAADLPCDRGGERRSERGVAELESGLLQPGRAPPGNC